MLRIHSGLSILYHQCLTFRKAHFQNRFANSIAGVMFFAIVFQYNKKYPSKAQKRRKKSQGKLMW